MFRRKEIDAIDMIGHEGFKSLAARIDNLYDTAELFVNDDIKLSAEDRERHVRKIFGACKELIDIGVVSDEYKRIFNSRLKNRDQCITGCDVSGNKLKTDLMNVFEPFFEELRTVIKLNTVMKSDIPEDEMKKVKLEFLRLIRNQNCITTAFGKRIIDNIFRDLDLEFKGITVKGKTEANFKKAKDSLKPASLGSKLWSRIKATGHRSGSTYGELVEPDSGSSGSSIEDSGSIRDGAQPGITRVGTKGGPKGV